MEAIKQKLQRLERFLEQDPNNVSLILEVSECYALLGDKANAQVMIDKARSIDEPAAQVAQGLLHLNFGELDQATEVFKRALVQNNTPSIRYNLAFCFYANKQYEQAHEILAPVIEQQAERFPIALILMARIEHHRDNIEHGIQLLNQHQQLSTNNAEGLGLLSLLYFDAEDYEKAQQTCQKALALDSRNIDALSVDTYLNIASQKADGEAISQLIQRSPQDGRLYFALGNALLKEDKIEAAVLAFKTSDQLLPGFSENQLILGWSYLMLDDLNNAKQAFSYALNQQDDFAEAYGGLAIVEVLAENLEAGMELIKKAMAIDSNSHLATLAQALYYNHSDKEQAQFFYQKAIKDMAEDAGLPINAQWIEQLNPKNIH